MNTDAIDARVEVLAKKLNYEFINSVYKAKGSTHDSEWDLLGVGEKRMHLFIARFIIESGVVEKIKTHGDGDGYEVGELAGVKSHNAACDTLLSPERKEE